VRVAIRRGQEMTAQGDLGNALAEFNKALAVNHNSSLAHYRIAEVFMSSATTNPRPTNTANRSWRRRTALDGSLEPLGLGKIFDITGQRERAVGEYRQAYKRATQRKAPWMKPANIWKSLRARKETDGTRGFFQIICGLHPGRLAWGRPFVWPGDIHPRRAPAGR